MTIDERSKALFDLQNVFEVEDYLFAYQDDLGPERSQAEVDRLLELLEVSSPLRILDLACGFGRHANRLAALGHTVTGVDLVPGFLEIARREAKAMGLQVDYRQTDMRRVRFRETFDLALLLFTSFGYFEDDGNEQVLHRMTSALKPGGRLVIDTMNRDAVLRDFPPAQVIEKGNDLLINRVSFDVLTGRLHNRRILIRNGVRREKPFSIRLYSATEMLALLTRLGLLEVRLLDEKNQPVSASSRRLVALARKPGK